VAEESAWDVWDRADVLTRGIGMGAWLGGEGEVTKSVGGGGVARKGAGYTPMVKEKGTLFGSTL